MNYAQQIIDKYNKEKEDRINRTLQPIRDDKALENKVLLSVCDNCGDEHKCKVVPFSNGNMILCHSCHTKEMNYLRMNFNYNMTMQENQDQLSVWYQLKWYNLPE